MSFALKCLVYAAFPMSVAIGLAYAAEDKPVAKLAQNDKPSIVITGSEESSSDAPPSPIAPAASGRVTLVQVSDAEFAKIDLAKIFAEDFPLENASTGGPEDLRAFYGVQPYVVRPSGGLATAKRSGYIVPRQVIDRAGLKLAENPTGLSQPEWLSLVSSGRARIARARD